MARPDGGRGDGALAVQVRRGAAKRPWHGSPAPCCSAHSWCSRSSRCSPAWRCRCSAARPPSGTPRWCSSRARCLPAMPTPTASAAASVHGQVAGHLSLLALASLSLPVAIGGGWEPPAGAMSIPWLIALMAWTVGLPLVAVAATAPLIPTLVRGQRAHGSRRPILSVRGEQPGSILALLSYPSWSSPP